MTTIIPTSSLANPFSKFDDIRPYVDSEVPGVIARLWDSFAFRQMLRLFFFQIYGFRRIGNISSTIDSVLNSTTIDEFQSSLLKPAGALIKRTTSSLTYEGLENITSGGHIFVSNHRDIVFDPLLLNYILRTNGHETCAIGIGDNLVSYPYIEDCVRLNKSFLVRRSLKNREHHEAMLHQSQFIFQYVASGRSIWIAQRQGRAKDGNDSTQPAVLNMLYLGEEACGLSFHDTMSKLSLIPVSISYEYDPLGVKKATELYHLQTTAKKYKKSKWEDYRSMKRGLFGNKGRVHLSFGKPVAALEDKRALAKAIDAQIIGNYYLWPSNLFAFRLQTDPATKPQDKYEHAFMRELGRVPAELRGIYLAMYANPVINRNAL